VRHSGLRPILPSHAGSGRVPAPVTVRSGIPERRTHGKRRPGDDRSSETGVRHHARRQLELTKIRELGSEN